jgi:hypothetical protein
MKRILQSAGWLFLLVSAPLAFGQVQVGNDVRMQMNGSLTGGYSANYGNQMPTSHSLNFGADAQLVGDYYNPNFLTFNISPYYNRSTSDSNFQSLTDASGVNTNVNLFTGSKYPGYVSFNYARNSTGDFGLIGTPNFTTIGTGYSFAVGWSVLLPNKPTLSFSYSEGSGGGNVFGTKEESHATTKTLNVRSSYRWAGWNLNAYYQHLSFDSQIPLFLSGQSNTDFSSSSGNSIGVNGSHSLPWNGSIGLTFTHSTYSGDFGGTMDPYKSSTDYSTNMQSATISFHPTNKLTIFGNENLTDNLNGYLYQNILNNGGGLPIRQDNSSANSFTTSGGASYNILSNLYTQAQITYFQQSYFGNTYNGSFLSATLGYNKRILNTFAVSATVVESNNKFADNGLGFVVNVNAFRPFGDWLASGNFSYAQNVQTLLVTYTTSYYNYSGNVHRRLGRGKQVTFAYNGSHSGLNQDTGSYSYSNSGSASLSLRLITMGANYTSSKGLSILTSTGIQPLQPTPGLPPLGQIVYNGQSYGLNIGIMPLPRLTISGTYTHAVSDTLSSEISSKNRTEIYYAQLQYRLRRINVFAGYTKFTQGISAAGTPPGTNYSYFIGVSRWLHYF